VAVTTTRSSGRRASRVRPCGEAVVLDDQGPTSACFSAAVGRHPSLHDAAEIIFFAFVVPHLSRDDATCRTTATAHNRSSLAGLARSASARKCTLLRRRVLPRRVRTRARRDQAKQGDPPYRSERWPERQKIKCVPRDTFVIGGYGGATVTGAIDRLLLAAKKGAELVRCRMEQGIRAASRASRHHAGDPPTSCAETKGRAISATYRCR
jgi:bifunctional non-homologous end joining protein LigD